MAQLLITTKGRITNVVLPDLTEEEVLSFSSIAEAILYVHTQHPKANNRSIADLVSKYHTKEISTNWVYNVLNKNK